MGIKTDGFQNGKFFELLKLGILGPVCFGTCLGGSLAAPRGVSKQMGFKVTSFLSFENRYFDTRLFWYPFGFLPRSHKPTLLNGPFGNCKAGGCEENRQPLANPLPTLRQPFANLSPTFSANLFCQGLSKLLFPWAQARF